MAWAAPLTPFAPGSEAAPGMGVPVTPCGSGSEAAPGTADSWIHLTSAPASTGANPSINQSSDLDSIKGAVLKCIDKLFDTYGGPVQYLRQQFNTPESREKYVSQL